MNSFIQVIANLIANVLERSFGTKPSVLLTIAGIASAVSAGLAAVPSTVIPAKYQPWLVGAAGVLGLLAGALGYGGKPTTATASPEPPKAQ